METTEQTKLKFIDVEIVEVDYKFFSKAVGVTSITVESKAGVYYPQDNKAFEIIIDLKVKCEQFFYVNLRAIGKFEMDGEVTDFMKKTFINISAPSIVFPYLRAFVSNFTANLGGIVRSINLPPQIFQGELIEYKAEELTK